jgi:hypothetical protein
MKLARMMLAALLVIAALAPVTHPARAASVDSTDGYASSDVGGAPTAPAASDPTGSPNSKGGVLAAAGCGFALASLVLAPNPLSAFVVGFDCGFFFLDAVDTPDR